MPNAKPQALALLFYFNTGPHTSGFKMRARSMTAINRLLRNMAGKYRVAILYEDGNEIARYKPET